MRSKAEHDMEQKTLASGISRDIDISDSKSGKDESRYRSRLRANLSDAIRPSGRSVYQMGGSSAKCKG